MFPVWTLFQIFHKCSTQRFSRHFRPECCHKGISFPLGRCQKGCYRPGGEPTGEFWARDLLWDWNEAWLKNEGKKIDCHWRMTGWKLLLFFKQTYRTAQGLNKEQADIHFVDLWCETVAALQFLNLVGRLTSQTLQASLQELICSWDKVQTAHPDLRLWCKSTVEKLRRRRGREDRSLSLLVTDAKFSFYFPTVSILHLLLPCQSPDAPQAWWWRVMSSPSPFPSPFSFPFPFIFYLSLLFYHLIRWEREREREREREFPCVCVEGM